MHEGSIASNIIAIVKSELSKRQVRTQVERIKLRAGRLNAIVPDSLSFHFDVQKKDHPQLKDAVLEVLQAPLLAECSGCGKAFELESPIFVCDSCGEGLNVKSGHELLVESISVAD